VERVAAEGEATAAPAGPAPGGPVTGPAGSLPARGIDGAALRALRGGGATQFLQQLQRTAGNQAVGALLRRAEEEEDRELRTAVDGVRGTLARAHLDRHANRSAAEAALGSGVAVIQRDEDDEAGGTVALDAPAGGGGGGGGGGGSPVFNHSGSTVTINADSAPDFSNRITATIGTPHTEIVIEPDVQYDYKTGPDGNEIKSTRKIASVGLTITTKIVKVRFGMGRPNDKHKKAIDEMVALIEAHENQHRAIIVAEATAALTKAQKLVGTNKVDQAYKILDHDLDCAAAKKHEALDAKEGLLTAVEQSNGDVSITKSASGAKYPCGAGAAKSP
jgi:hypothetical protein